jgi:TRAP-type C4-dicarboxylate transport system permease small subunit
VTGLARLSRRIDQGAEVLTSALLAAVVLINGLELAARNFFNHSFVWAYEVNLLLGAWVYFLGMTVVYHRRGDIMVEYLTGLLPAGARRAWVAVCNLVVLGVLAVIAWYAWVLIELQAGFRTTGLGIPNPWFTAPVLTGALLMALHVASQTGELLRRGRR